MSDDKYGWTVERAMEIVRHPTVDPQIWAEAVEWLLLNGPEEIRRILQDASGHATIECFPSMCACGSTDDGEQCYNVADLAAALGISEEEAAEIIREKEERHGVQQLFSAAETKKVQ